MFTERKKEQEVGEVREEVSVERTEGRKGEVARSLFIEVLEKRLTRRRYWTKSNERGKYWRKE